jgi:hypothetical protein
MALSGIINGYRDLLIRYYQWIPRPAYPVLSMDTETCLSVACSTERALAIIRVRSPLNGSARYSSEASACKQSRAFALLNRHQVLSIDTDTCLSCIIDKYRDLIDCCGYRSTEDSRFNSYRVPSIDIEISSIDIYRV